MSVLSNPMPEGPHLPTPSATEGIQWFQRQALSVLRELCPERRIAPGANPWTVRVDALQVALNNAFVESQRQPHDVDAVRGLLRTRFAALLVEDPPATEASLAENRARVLPQFMPANYAGLAPVVSFPFHGELDIGLVVDGSKTYRYVKCSDLDRWGLTEAAALELAVANLDRRSHDLPVHFAGDGPEKFVALETRDGFDAARILVPRLQRFVADRLGDPFGFAIPNRDFLICWSAANSATFRAGVTAKVAQDFAERPYALSPAIFRWTNGRIIKEA